MLEYVPSSFKVIAALRPEAELPRLRDDRAGADAVRCRSSAACRGPGLIAHVLVSKFCDHTPLHRQTDI